MPQFSLIRYSALNSRQKEVYNFQKVSGVLADYGFATLHLTDDWNGADFLGVHVDGRTVLRIQLKSRLTFSKKYLGRDLWVCFRHDKIVYLYPHDKTASDVRALAIKLKQKRYDQTVSWRKPNGGYSFPAPPKWLMAYLQRYKLGTEGESALQKLARPN